MKFHLLAILLGSALAFAAFGADTSAPATVSSKIKVLIVDGYSNHDWKQNTALLRGILEPTGLFDVTVSTTPASKQDWNQWRPNFKKYDVVIQTCNDINNSGPEWPRDVQIAFENYVRDGGGVYIYHSAQNAFQKWPAYNQMIGLGWRGADFGTAISIDADEKLVRHPPNDGPGTGHAPKGDVIVHLLGNHPIHEGLPKAWKTPALEVYHYARGPAENLDVLSYGQDPEGKLNWPIEWTVRYGNGRVYVATFGHVWKGDVNPVTLRCAGVQTMIVRCLQWLAGRPVTYPVPPDFPTADKTSVRPEIVNLDKLRD